MPNQVTLNYLPDSCANLVEVYPPALASAIHAGAALVIAGVALLGWYLKRRA